MSKTIVVIPTYNESENVIILIDCLLGLGPDIDILIVDDNSPDGTASMVKNHVEFNSRLFLVLRSEKNGLGKAYISGFDWSLERDYTFIVQMDADFSHPYAVLPEMITLSGVENAIVIGSRWIEGGGVVGWPMHRLLISRTGSTYSRIFLGVKTRDVTSGFKVIPAKYLHQINYSKFVSSGYSFQIELQENIRLYNLPVIEFPIIFTERIRGKSKMSPKIAIEAFIFVLRIFMSRNLRKLDLK